jgi:FKBP-type peptidyl-prolyl cis-trans isomerase
MVGSLLAMARTLPLAPRAAAAAAVQARRGLAAAPAAPLRFKRQSARRQFTTSVCAQSLQKDITVEGSGASPKQGDKV